MGRFDGRVAFITGGARGQGRAHALRLAAEGADVVIVDAPLQPASVHYPLGTADELAETAERVEALDRRCLPVQADVRDPTRLAAAVDMAVAEFGRIDFCVANAAVLSRGLIAELSDETWHDVIDINLTGVFNTVRAVVPPMLAQGSGRIVATSSLAGRTGLPYLGHYAAAKWGVIGLVKTLALEVAAQGITVNAVLPTSVDTPMILGPEALRDMLPQLENPTREDAAQAFGGSHAIPVPWIEPEDVAAAVAFLCSDEARYITGETLSVTAGATARNSA